jgi:predicted Zn-dependent protease
VDPDAFLLYAEAAEKQNHADAARQALVHYNDLTADERNFSERALRVAQLSARVNDFKTAADWLLRALVDRPADVRLLALLADAQMKTGDQAAAEKTIARGLEADPNNRSLLALARRMKPAR